MNQIELLGEFLFKELSLGMMVLNVVVVMVLSSCLSLHYQRYARVLSNKKKFARVLVFLSLTTLLIISVVKTSLALSLGLVGALSIIRFRTPIKEPEELAYLFLAIAVGIGVGADKILITCVVFVSVLAYFSMQGRRDSLNRENLVMLQVSTSLDLQKESRSSGKDQLKALTGIVESITLSADIRRIDRHEDNLNVTILLELSHADDMGRLLDQIQEQLPGSSVTMVDKDSLD